MLNYARGSAVVAARSQYLTFAGSNPAGYLDFLFFFHFPVDCPLIRAIAEMQNPPKNVWTQLYKNIFGIDLRYTGIIGL